MRIHNGNFYRDLRHAAGGALMMACVAGFASPRPISAGDLNVTAAADGLPSNAHTDDRESAAVTEISARVRGQNVDRSVPELTPPGDRVADEAEIATLLDWHLGATGAYGAAHPEARAPSSRRAEPDARAESARDQSR